MALLASTFAINGALTYAFTGKKPEGVDWFAFRDGGHDEHGNPTRLVLPTYMKDILSYAKDAKTTLANKTHPLITLGMDLNKNQDYYGTEIRHPDDSPLTQAGQVTKYVAKQFVPFWLRGAQKQADEGKGLGSQAAAFFGIMPAPRHMVQTEAEAEASRIMAGKRPVGGRTQEQANRADAKSQVALGKVPAIDAIRQGLITTQDAQNLRKQSVLPPLTRTITHLSAEEAVRVLEKANEDERLQILPMVKSKIGGSTSLTITQKRALMQRVTK
jgi:hypothetical protein